MQRIAAVQTKFQYVEVWKSAWQTEFRVEQAVHAWHHTQRFLTGLAWDNMIAAALLHPQQQPRSVLMLGFAGGTTFHGLRHLLPEASLTAVEIDAEIIQLAEAHMNLGALRCQIHLADAYQWMAECREKFDVVIDDVYLAGHDDVYRPGSWDDRNMLALKKLLRPEGLLLTNLVRGQGHRPLQSRIRALYRRHFPCVKEVRTPAGLNETLVGGNHVAGQAALRRWRDGFSSPRDRQLWDQITVRKLAPLAHD
jgi:spermidine synthase